MDVTVTLTDAQAKVAQAMDRSRPVTAIVQAHVDEWLQPEVSKLEAQQIRELTWAYRQADTGKRARIRAELGLKNGR